MSVCVGCLFLRTPSRAPYRTPPACANRAAYPDPPPVVPDPESIDSGHGDSDTTGIVRHKHKLRVRVALWRFSVPATRLLKAPSTKVQCPRSSWRKISFFQTGGLWIQGNLHFKRFKMIESHPKSPGNLQYKRLTVRSRSKNT